MRTRTILLASLLLLAGIGLGPGTGTAAALHVCIDGPCDDHGPVDDVPLLKTLLCKLTGGQWSSSCYT